MGEDQVISAFLQGTFSDIQEASFLGLTAFAEAFGDVRRNGNGGPAHLVRTRTSPGRETIRSTDKPPTRTGAPCQTSRSRKLRATGRGIGIGREAFTGVSSRYLTTLE